MGSASRQNASSRIPHALGNRWPPCGLESRSRSATSAPGGIDAPRRSYRPARSRAGSEGSHPCWLGRVSYNSNFCSFNQLFGRGRIGLPPPFGLSASWPVPRSRRFAFVLVTRGSPIGVVPIQEDLEVHRWIFTITPHADCHGGADVPDLHGVSDMRLSAERPLLFLDAFRD